MYTQVYVQHGFSEIFKLLKIFCFDVDIFALIITFHAANISAKESVEFFRDDGFSMSPNTSEPDTERLKKTENVSEH